MSDKYQVITLTTSDGKKHFFTGKATLTDDFITVIKVEVSLPSELPKDMYFETIGENIE